MSAKVEQASAVEPRLVQATVTANASAASSSPKISMFAKKSGFVIPKNKLSGSLVPIYRGGKKSGSSDAVNEESTHQVQRKTKWGPDLTQDTAVRKGRALAYQTRVEQIRKLLSSGSLETVYDEDPPLAAQIPDHDSSNPPIKNKDSESLELEKREAIGEILKLNPSYKVPPDYKPLLKEAKVFVPIKEYPGYNFVALIFGAANDTQKRLEKETGAKIRVYGTKADSEEKAEITPSNGNEAHGAYKELYVQISADTYEKVDAAVALIELLVTPVSGNPSAVSTTSTSVSGDSMNVADQGQVISAAYTISSVGINKEVAQPIIGSIQTPHQVQFQPYQGPWFTAGPPQSPIRPNTSAPILSNPIQASPSPFSPSNMPSLFGPRPVLTAGFGTVPYNPSLVPPRSQPVLHHPFMPQAPSFSHSGMSRNPPFPAVQPTPAQPSFSAPPPFTGNHTSLVGLPSFSQPMSRPLSGPLPDLLLSPAGSSTQWSQSLAGTRPFIGLGTMAGMAPPVVSFQGPHPVTSQPISVSGAPPPSVSAVNLGSPSTFPSMPSAPNPSSTPVNHPIEVPSFTSGPHPQAGLPPPSLIPTLVPLSAPRLIQSSPPFSAMRPVLAQAMTPNPSPNPVASTSTTQPPSQPGSSTFTPMSPSVPAPKPQHPNSSDFTFQPHRPPNQASQVAPRPGIQPTSQNMPPPNPMAQSFWPAMRTPSPQPAMQGSPRAQLSNQMNQPQTQMSSFAGNPTVAATPIRHPAFPNPNPGAPTSPVPQVGPRNFMPAPRVANFGGPFPPRPGNPLQLPPNYPAAAGRPQSLLSPNQQLGSNFSFASGRPASGAQQIYDPFSPTSVSNALLQGDNSAKVRKQESDPEYEDLMASVGVK